MNNPTTFKKTESLIKHSKTETLKSISLYKRL